MGQVWWKPPTMGRVKVNFDGAISLADKRGGIGVVIKNEEGECMGALSAKIFWIEDPTMVEAIAAVRALKFA
ncbi:hypothetical protein PTKIN_Ptkin12aG0158100 [Pterospermum kingtungense]